MKRCIILLYVLVSVSTAHAQMLSLDSCVAMAVRENTQLKIAKIKADMATNTRKAARTKYLPNISATGTYMRTGKQLSILSEDQQNALSNIGTTLANNLGATMQNQQTMMQIMQTAASMGINLTPQHIQQLQEPIANLAKSLNQTGATIAEAFDTDTRNMFGAAVTLKQPLFMGGKIAAGNKMAQIAEEIAQTQVEQAEEDVKFNVENTYYLVVGIEHKKRLADEFASLVAQLSADVSKMVQEGVATRADELKVSVRLNEAQMQQLQAENGLALSKMLLCKLCGLPVNSDISVDTTTVVVGDAMGSFTNNRAELKMLGQAVELYNAKVKTERAEHLPQVALVGGYMVSNPSLFNGFEKKFKGTWNVGLMVNIPIWDWNETGYKVRSAKGQAAIAQLQLTEAEQLIDMQIAQCQVKYDEAQRKLALTNKNFDKAEENLRCANMGFEEGVMTSSDVMMAQTAWLQAKTQVIEAQIEVITAQLALSHAYGN